MEELAKRRILFVVFATWSRSIDVSLAPKQEYEMLRTRVSEKSGLFVGSVSVAEDRHYDGVFVLRDRLATVGDIKEWIGLGAQVQEPRSGDDLRVFLQKTQDFCARGDAETFGERVVVETGDVESMVMFENLPDWRRLGSSSGEEVGWWTRRVRWFHDTAEEAEVSRVARSRGAEAQMLIDEGYCEK
jgi:hypothetical protein